MLSIIHLHMLVLLSVFAGVTIKLTTIIGESPTMVMVMVILDVRWWWWLLVYARAQLD